MDRFDVKWFEDRMHEYRVNQRALSEHLDCDKSTAHNILRGKRILKLSEIEGMAKFLQSTPFEILSRAGMDLGQKAVQTDNSNIKEVSTKGGLSTDVVAEWGIPSDYLGAYLDVDPASSRVIVVQGDGMEPTLRAGDRVMLDMTDTVPSPPGLFAIFDGMAVSVKRLEPVLGANPISVNVISDNAAVADVIVAVADIKILGRIVWSARKM